MKTPKLELLLAMLLCFVFTAELRSQTTAFNYLGELAYGGVPVNGTYDLTFSLWTSVSGPAQVGGTLTNLNKEIINGRFSVTLDFGAGVFPGADRWLQIGVRTNGAVAFTNLSPRAKILPTPYAIRSATATSAASVSGSVAAAQLVGQISSNNIGNGTIHSTKLANGAVTAEKIAAGAVSQLGAPDGSLSNVVQVTDDGLVGIGTTAPDAGLHIRTSSSILSPNVLFQVRDGTGNYTNLGYALDVVSSGNLLAVTGFYDDAITLLDISNPASPIIRSQIKDGSGAFTNLDGSAGLALSGNLLVVAAQNDSAVTLISVTNPASPVRLATLRDGVGGFNELSGAFQPALSGNLLAVAATFDSAVTLVDISNPASPVLRAVLKDGVGGFDQLSSVSGVAFSGNLLAIAAQYENAVTLVDVSNPASPVLRAVLKDGVGGFDQLREAYAVAFSGSLLAIAAPFDHAVTLVDVSVPTNPVLRAVLKDGENGFFGLAAPLHLAFSGNLLAITATASDDAVTLVDVSDPANPVLKMFLRNAHAGINYMEGPVGVTFAGTNLAVAGRDSDSLTLIQPTKASVGLVSEGWVGIGTTMPGAPLHVMGNVVVEDATTVELRARQVAFGYNTVASGNYSTAMGGGTIASGDGSTAMGDGTTARGPFSTAMGVASDASGYASTAMGYLTKAGGAYSIAMGYQSEATNTWTFAAGRRAKANHTGTFVWADSQNADFTSTDTNQFLIRAQGGVGIGTTNPDAQLHVSGNASEPQLHLEQTLNNDFARLRFSSTTKPHWDLAVGGNNNVMNFYNSGNGNVMTLTTNGDLFIDGALNPPSDRNMKQDFDTVNSLEVLEKVATLPIQTWAYKNSLDTRHIGPVAQDFHAAFGLGTDDKHIATVDADGVALAAIQGLNQKLEEKERRIQELETAVRELRELIRKGPPTKEESP